MFRADDVRKGYKGCYSDRNGPYVMSIWGNYPRTLPVALYVNELTHEQCAQAAGLAGYEVFALQGLGHCFMGTFADVDQMKQKFDDGVCNTTPCLVLDGCLGLVNKVYSIGAPSAPRPLHGRAVSYLAHGQPSCKLYNLGAATKP